MPISKPDTEKALPVFVGRFAAKLMVFGLILSGCARFGPDQVVQDRFNYTQALSDSWKDQMLFNMVKLRYGDTPIFLDVVSVINSYEVSGSADLGGSWRFNPDFESGASLSARGFYANRPTITYSPLSGERFAKTLMAPLPVSAIFYLIQAGYPADLVLRILVQSVNGVKNRYGGVSEARHTDIRYHELVEKIKRIQASGALGLKAQRINEEEVIMMVFEPEVDTDTEAQIAAVKKILGLDPGQMQFTLTYGLMPVGDNEIAVLSRSVLQVLSHLASYIEVPESHVAEKRVLPTYKDDFGNGVAIAPLIRVHHSAEKPLDAFFAVPYHQYWFWIDDRDLQSKQIFSFMMFLFTLTESGGTDSSPIVTVPVR